MLMNWEPSNLLEYQYDGTGMKITQFHQHALIGRTEQGRSLLIAEFLVRMPQTAEIRPLYIATSYFESMPHVKYKEMRFSQMKDTFARIFKGERNVIVLGDYSFDMQEYTKNITQFGFKDVIIDFEKEPEYKFEHFDFTVAATKFTPSSRTDKVCVPIKNEKRFIVPTNAQKVGNFNVFPFQNDKVTDIEKDDTVRTPS